MKLGVSKFLRKNDKQVWLKLWRMQQWMKTDSFKLFVEIIEREVVAVMEGKA